MNKPASVVVQHAPARDSQNNLLGHWQIMPPDLCLIPIDNDNRQSSLGILVADQDRICEVRRGGILDFPRNGTNELAALSIHNGPFDKALEDSYITTLLKLAEVIDHCHPFTRCHAQRTSLWAHHLALKLGLDPIVIDQIAMAGKLHDIGKVVVPQEILLKPDRLTVEDWEQVKRHPIFGAVLLEPVDQFREIIPAVRYHHECYDGKGYPDGIGGEEIPLMARIISVADAYTTMTDGRVYRRASTPQEAATELIRCSGTQFDPQIVEVMVEAIWGNDIVEKTSP